MLTCTKLEMVALLGEFIRSTSDARELKRAGSPEYLVISRVYTQARSEFQLP